MTIEHWGQVARLADEQWGLITTAQATARGVTRASLSRWTAAHVIERITQGVHGFPGATDSPLVYDRALWLSLDPETSAANRLRDRAGAGVLSHTTAARVLGLGNLLDSRTVVTLPIPRRIRRLDLDLRVGVLDHEDIELVQGLPVTTPTRTIRDLLAAGEDLDHIADVLGDTLHSRPLSLGALANQVEAVATIRGFDDGPALIDHLLELIGLDELSVAK